MVIFDKWNDFFFLVSKQAEKIISMRPHWENSFSYSFRKHNSREPSILHPQPPTAPNATFIPKWKQVVLVCKNADVKHRKEKRCVYMVYQALLSGIKQLILFE